MPIITTKRGLNWYCETHGEGETLLFIHGFGTSQRLWADQVKYFSTNFHVVTVDLPGHGQSGWRDVSLNDMAIDIKFILEKLDLHQVNGVASSFGGLITLKLYKVCPEKLQRVSFVGALPKFARSENYPAGLDIERIHKLSNQFDGDYATILDIFFRSLFSKQDRESERFQWIKHVRQNDALPRREALKKFLDILEHEDLRDILANLQYRVQFINGTEDYICTMEIMQWLESMVTYGRFDYIQGTGHFSFLSRPQEFNQLLEEFLTA